VVHRRRIARFEIGWSAVFSIGRQANMIALAEKFHQEMLAIYERARNECDYHHHRFLQMVQEDGGLEVAHRLLEEDSVREGLVTLWRKDRLDLTVEALVLKPEYEPLFTEEEISKARKRLEHLGATAIGHSASN
jgi:hypothetical protein